MQNNRMGEAYLGEIVRPDFIAQVGSLDLTASTGTFPLDFLLMLSL